MIKICIKLGRPTIVDKATAQKLEQAFRDGLAIEEACSLSDITSTYPKSRHPALT